jgi:hypothetical protein
MTRSIRVHILVVGICLLVCSSASAQTTFQLNDDATVLRYLGCDQHDCPQCPAPCANPCVEEDPFARGGFSVEVLTGAYFCPVHMGPHSTPTFDFEATDVRLGYMLSSTIWDGTMLRGNWEVLLEVTIAPVFDGPGNIVVGPSAILRRNFMEADSPWTFYLQAGGGIIYTDSYREQQPAIGQATEFYLSAAAGCRYAIDAQWALLAEFGYIHISNAGLAQRNGGINALGASVGVAYSFP